MTVHISGHGIITSLGLNANDTFAALLNGQTAARFMPEWSLMDGLHSHVACPVPDYDASVIPRQKRRTMSRMSEIGCLALNECLHRAELNATDLHHHRIMIIVGSTTGSAITLADSHRQVHENGSFQGQLSTTVFKCMSHSLALNLASYLDFNGPVLAPSSACSTGAQAILLGKQMIDGGLADIVIAGGADECHMTSCFSFDAALAASRNFNDCPHRASRPFDASRDGIVVSEGASLVVLESEQSLQSRRVNSYGRILGGAHRCDGRHVSKPQVDSMTATISDAINHAGILKQQIGYVNAHATSTRIGDLCEAQAVEHVFQRPIAISSLKGHLGHSFAAAGSTEAIIVLKMFEESTMIGTKNLETVDEKMPDIDFVRDNQPLPDGFVLSNSFAFGGMNVSLVLASA